jgi:valyl-tRNA synthetase
LTRRLSSPASNKEIGKLRADLDRTEKELANPSFVGKAPPLVVQKERDKLSEQRTAIGKLEEQERKIRSL